MVRRIAEESPSLAECYFRREEEYVRPSPSGGSQPPEKMEQRGSDDERRRRDTGMDGWKKNEGEELYGVLKSW